MQSEILGVWERGEGQPAWRRALALLSASGRAAGAELASIPIGRRDALLLELREQFFGNLLTGVTSCPACSEEIELTFEAAEVRRGGGEPPATFSVTAGGYDVVLRLPGTSDVASIACADSIAAARWALFAHCVITARRGDAPVEAAGLPPEIIDAAAARMAELDPQADVTMEVACPSCAHAWLEPFDIVAFLWSELAAAARRLLREVHQLAAAYGWSEGEILALSPARRGVYLEMLG
jgi:hypothetical protein